MFRNTIYHNSLLTTRVPRRWMWINESMYSTVFAYSWGIAAPVWFASGLSF